MLTEKQRGYNMVVEGASFGVAPERSLPAIKRDLIQAISIHDTEDEIDFLNGMVEALDDLMTKVA
jgi:hypothetical protein